MAARPSANAAPVSQTPGLEVPVVAIGASAGGIDALERFLGALPERPGAAFVVLTHLDPSKDSALDALLGRSTTMPVTQAEPGEDVEPNHVYLLPPDKVMEFRHGKLMLLPRPAGQRVPLAVDRFFASLAKSQGRRSFCVVLSGAGTDGCSGAKAVKEAGGHVLVQDKDSARMPSMPSSAARAGVADFILPPDQLAKKLMGLLAGRPGVIAPVPQLELSDAQFQTLFSLLRQQTGHDFSLYKRTTVLRRLENRLVQCDLDDPEAYLALLTEDAAEVDALFRELCIGVTRFFRDPHAFQALEQSLAAVLENKAPGERLRVWVPGCSTGEEAYSVAMVLQEQMQRHDKPLVLELYATDIDAAALERARRGVYSSRIEEHVSSERLAAFFERTPAGYRVRDEIRDQVRFAEQNLVKDPPFSQLDLISCRNLLIYFTAELQRRIVPLFHYALTDGGLLFLGGSESVGRFSSLFLALDRSRRVYRKRAAEAMYWLSDLQPQPEASEPQTQTSAAPKPALGHDEQRHKLQDLLLEEFAPPGAIVDRNYRVLHFCGDTSRYLRAPVEGSNDLLALARRGLSGVLRRTVRRAFEEGEEIIEPALPLAEHSSLTAAQVHAKPLALPHGGERVVLVTFQAPQPLVISEAGGGEAQNRADLDRELRRVEESLHATVEELENSNEELRTVNEEWQASNEELQSTNAELEASREELKCLNDELAGVNAELEQKIEQLTRANSDVRRVLDSLHLPILFFDEQGHMKLCTPEAGELLGEADRSPGLAVSEVAARLGVDDLASQVGHVVESGEPQDHTVVLTDGARYRLRIAPQREGADGPDGVVVTLQPGSQA